MELINVTYFDPAGPALFKGAKNDKATATLYYCSNKTNCDLHKIGQCVMARTGFNHVRCEYGKVERKVGYTKRARAHHKWISNIKETHADYLWAMERAGDRIAYIGDYVYLPYSYMSLDNKLFKEPGGVFSQGLPFIPKDKWNEHTALSLIGWSPRAMMGDIIKDYQLKVVPKFCKDLQDSYPDLFAKIVALDNTVLDKVESYSYIGRKALISSLKLGVKISKTNKNESWLWDGEYLTSTNYNMLFAIVKHDSIEVKIKPKENESIEITSNDQVDAATIFID